MLNVQVRIAINNALCFTLEFKQLIIIRPETTKLLEEIIGSMLFDIDLSNNLLGMYPQARETKTKINKWDYIRLKSFCTVKETINKTKRQPTEWEKILASDISNNGLISKTYKELIQLNIKKPTKLCFLFHIT